MRWQPASWSAVSRSAWRRPPAAPSRGARSRAESGSRRGGDHRREEAEAVGAWAGQRVDGVLGVRHQADDVAALVRDAGDVGCGAVRVDLEVAGDDPPLALERGERVAVCDVAALTVLERDDDLLPGRVPGRPRRRRVLDPQALVAADELAVVVADERPRQQVALAQNLKAVADSEHRHAGVGGRDDVLHHRREPGDRAAAQIVAVREAAGQDDRLDAFEVVLAMPQRDRLAAAEGHGTAGVAVVERARERDDADLHDGSTLTV